MKALTLKLHQTLSDRFSLSLQCDLPSSGVTAIFGPSGSGKTTLLNCIAGLNPAPANTTIQFNDTSWCDNHKQAPAWERRIGYVFQDARLFPHLSVKDNLLYGAKRSKIKATLDLKQTAELLELSTLLDRTPDTLSAGERQRVAIGRALLSAPQLLLMDEPMANLDHTTRQHCLRCLQKVVRETHVPLLYVSHDIEEVSQIADHIVLLESGRIVDHGPLVELCSRLDSQLASDEQAAAIIYATVTNADDGFGLTQLRVDQENLWVAQLDHPQGTRCRLRIPARDVSLCLSRPQQSSILNILAATVADIEQTRAARVMVRLRLGEQFLLARITRRSLEELQLSIGDKVFAQIKSTALLLETVTQK